VRGKPGVDFPVLTNIPKTSFSCRDIESGYYADLETRCQVFHICEDGKKISFLCPNGTIFQQADLICDWWFKVNCTNSPSLYEESSEQLKQESYRRKSARRKPITENNIDKVSLLGHGKKKIFTGNNYRKPHTDSNIPVHSEDNDDEFNKQTGSRFDSNIPKAKGDFRRNYDSFSETSPGIFNKSLQVHDFQNNVYVK
ncbi:hypothetical protein HHI36_013573, partial [Cryptolaemus montrouzieri]